MMSQHKQTKETAMEKLTLVRPQIQIQFFILSAIEETPEPAACYTAADFGFEIDPLEMAEALIAPLPAAITPEILPEVAPEDFERSYTWMLS
jgi:hypothetical protein